MTFDKGDLVRLTRPHSGLDKNYAPRSYRPGDRFTVLAHLAGEPVKVRDAGGISTLLVPADKLRRLPTSRGHDGDHPGGGPVG